MRKFIDGTVDIKQLHNTENLLLNKIDIGFGPRGFQVKALPSDEIVYWSFSRKKVNDYIKIQVSKNGFNVVFGDSLPCKRLDYEFRYSPSEYLIGLIITAIFGVILALGDTAVIPFTVFLFVLSGHCFWQYLKSKKIYNKALQRTSR